MITKCDIAVSNMVDANYEIFDKMKEQGEVFKGKKALFWAGKMSTKVKELETSNLFNVSQRIHLLQLIREEYDNEILKLVEK